LLNDKKLIKEIKKGSEVALEVLMQKYYKGIYSFITRRIGDSYTAYDLTQEVFIKMLNSVNAYNEEKGKFENWLLTIAINRCRDFYKSKGYKMKAYEVQITESIKDSSNVVSFLERNETLVEIKQAMQRFRHGRA